VGALYNKL